MQQTLNTSGLLLSLSPSHHLRKRLPSCLHPLSSNTAMLAYALAGILLATCYASSLLVPTEQPIFGIELTMNGAHAVSSLANGSLTPSATVQGNVAYRSHMSRWYELCNTGDMNGPDLGKITARVQNVFPIRHGPQGCGLNHVWNVFLTGTDLSWWMWMAWKVGWHKRDPADLYALDCYQQDPATAIIADLLSELHHKAIENLRKTGAGDEPLRPFAEMTLPSWFFAAMVGYPEYQVFWIQSRNVEQLVARISTAIHRAGFRRSFHDYPLSIIREHHTGAFSSLPPPPYHAPYYIMQHENYEQCADNDEPFTVPGSCRRYKHGDQFGATAAIDRTIAGSEESLSVWYEPHVGRQRNLSNTFWKTWKISGIGDVSRLEWRHGFEDVAEYVAGAWKPTAKLVPKGVLQLLLTGNGWAEDAVQSLHLALQALDVRYSTTMVSQYAAAAALAEESRGALENVDVCRLWVDMYAYGKPEGGEL